MFGDVLRFSQSALALTALATLAACGGGSGGGTGAAPAAVSGRIMDGYLVGAKVFWDCNNNFIPDPDEETVTSQAGGKYTISGSKNGQCPLHAVVPSTAIDEDTAQPVAYPYRLSAIPGSPEVITPLTTAVSLGLTSVAELQLKFPAQMSLSVTSDYIAAGQQGEQAHNAAKYFASALQLVDGVIANVEPSARAGALKFAADLIPASAFMTVDKTQDGIQTYRASLPSQSQVPSTLAATLDKAEFQINESALNGPNDPRRPFIEAALSAIKKNPGAVIGSSVRWSLVPESDRSAWAPNIVDGVNGFSDPARAKEISAFVRQKQREASDEIAALEDRTQASLGAMQAKHVFGVFATSVDSMVKLYPASSTGRKALYAVTKSGKLKASTLRAQTTYAKVKQFVDFVANCSSLGIEFNAIANSDSTSISKLADSALTLAKCAAQVAQSDQAVKMFKLILDGKAAVPATVEGDLLEFLKVMSDLASDGLDMAGADVASALYNETAGMLLNHFYNENQQLKMVAEYQGKLDDVSRAFDHLIDDSRGLMVAARLEPYIQPKHLINISLPVAAVVGEEVIGTIDQRWGQPLAYKLTWGRYPDSSPVANDSTWTSSGGSTSLAAVNYQLPGTYQVVIEISDTSLGGAVAPFQILTHSIDVSCPSGTAPDPDGICRVVGPDTWPVSFSDSFASSTLDLTRWRVANIDTRSAIPTYRINAGRLEVDVPGGTDGYMGVASGIALSPSVGTISGDFEFSINVSELLRQSRDGYKDNSGVGLEFGSASIRISGNYSGYWYMVGYNTYHKHRISADDGTGRLCGLNEALDLNTLYGVELRARRIRGVTTFGHRLNGVSNWTDWPCSMPDAAAPRITVWSGDGGVTRVTGRFVGAVDDVVLKRPSVQ